MSFLEYRQLIKVVILTGHFMLQFGSILPVDEYSLAQLTGLFPSGILKSLLVCRALRSAQTNIICVV